MALPGMPNKYASAGGGGAPFLDSEGNIVTNIKRMLRDSPSDKKAPVELPPPRPEWGRGDKPPRRSKPTNSANSHGSAADASGATPKQGRGGVAVAGGGGRGRGNGREGGRGTQDDDNTRASRGPTRALNLPLPRRLDQGKCIHGRTGGGEMRARGGEQYHRDVGSSNRDAAATPEHLQRAPRYDHNDRDNDGGDYGSYGGGYGRNPMRRQRGDDRQAGYSDRSYPRHEVERDNDYDRDGRGESHHDSGSRNRAYSREQEVYHRYTSGSDRRDSGGGDRHGNIGDGGSSSPSPPHAHVHSPLKGRMSSLADIKGVTEEQIQARARKGHAQKRMLEEQIAERAAIKAAAQAKEKADQKRELDELLATDAEFAAHYHKHNSPAILRRSGKYAGVASEANDNGGRRGFSGRQGGREDDDGYGDNRSGGIHRLRGGGVDKTDYELEMEAKRGLLRDATKVHHQSSPSPSSFQHVDYRYDQVSPRRDSARGSEWADGGNGSGIVLGGKVGGRSRHGEGSDGASGGGGIVLGGRVGGAGRPSHASGGGAGSSSGSNYRGGQGASRRTNDHDHDDDEDLPRDAAATPEHIRVRPPPVVRSGDGEAHHRDDHEGDGGSRMGSATHGRSGRGRGGGGGWGGDGDDGRDGDQSKDGMVRELMAEQALLRQQLESQQQLLLQQFEAAEAGEEGSGQMMKGHLRGGKGGANNSGARRAKSSQELIGRRGKLPYLKGAVGYENDDDDEDVASSNMGGRNRIGRANQRHVGSGKVLEAVDDGSGSLAMPKPRKPANSRRDPKNRNEVEPPPSTKERGPPVKSVQERLREEREQKKAAQRMQKGGFGAAPSRFGEKPPKPTSAAAPPPAAAASDKKTGGTKPNGKSGGGGRVAFAVDENRDPSPLPHSLSPSSHRRRNRQSGKSDYGYGSGGGGSPGNEAGELRGRSSSLMSLLPNSSGDSNGGIVLGGKVGGRSKSFSNGSGRDRSEVLDRSGDDGDGDELFSEAVFLPNHRDGGPGGGGGVAFEGLSADQLDFLMDRAGNGP